jgi:hypothetical protein
MSAKSSDTVTRIPSSRCGILSLGQMAALTDIIAKAFVLSNHNSAWQRRASSESFNRCLLCYYTYTFTPNGNRRSAWCAVLCSLSTDIASQGIKALRTKTGCDASWLLLPGSLTQRQQTLNAIQVFSLSSFLNQSLMSARAINVFFVHNDGLSYDATSLLVGCQTTSAPGVAESVIAISENWPSIGTCVLSSQWMM